MKQDEISLSSQALIELISSTLSKGASFRFKVKGSSMNPFVQDSDIVVISPVCNSSIGIGKLAAFVRPSSEKLVIHRIISENKQGIIAKGDGVAGIDGLIPKANILGIITVIERGDKPIKFGLGPEAILIGLLSRLNLLLLFFGLWMLIPLPARRFIKCRILS